MLIESEMAAANGLFFHCRIAGSRDAPMILMLHGFPEYSGAWEEMMERLGGDFFCVAPDQRGYARSSKPSRVKDYAARHLAGDALGLIDHFRPGGSAAAVFGHDWGASVAYALTFRAPERVGRLIIANGVHPVPFQCALAAGGAQSAASQYIDWLRVEGSEEKLLANDCAGMLKLFSARMDLGWLQGARLDAYRAAWTAEGAAKGMVDWYRASPMKVARPGEPIPPSELMDLSPEAVRVRVPHLLLWGLDDAALLPEAKEGLEEHCDDLRVVEFPGADHWLLHQKPDEIAAEVRRFLA